MFKLIGFCDGNYPGDRIDHRSSNGYCSLLGCSLMSWRSKKQNIVALFTAKVEYMATSSCCPQLLWMKHQLIDYNLSYEHIPLLCDNMSTINLTRNLVLYSRTKHLEIRHYFIHEHDQNGNIDVCYVKSE